MKETKYNLMLLITAMIWGAAFVAQSVAMDNIGPWTFTCIRNYIGAIVLLPIIRGLDHWHASRGEKLPADRKMLIRGGVVCGIALAAASMFQQVGIQYTTVGKAGFITALYVVMVPIASLFLGKKIRPVLWLCAGMSVVGLYLLSMRGSFRLSSGDTMVLICAVLYTVHILVIDYFVPYVDGARMSCIQFFTAGSVCLIPMLVFEHPQMSSIASAAAPILYAGVLSSGLGYTLQIIGQSGTRPEVASLICSLESVFAAVAGYLILHQALSMRELAGCIIMFAAIILAQLPAKGN